MKFLDPKLDLVFKRLLTARQELLHAMLEAVLGEPISELVVLNPEIPGDVATAKSIVLDIRVRLGDGRRVDVEMQMRTHRELCSRVLYYAARDYSGQLTRGQDYQWLTPTISVLWLVEPLFPDLRRLHSVFELRERATRRLFSDDMSIHVLQLSEISEPGAGASAAEHAVWRWATFLTAKSEVDMDGLRKQDPVMAIAVETLANLSADPELARQAREREDSLQLYEMSLRAREAHGRAEGREAERRRVIAELCRAFEITLSSEQRAELEAADADLEGICRSLIERRCWPE